MRDGFVFYRSFFESFSDLSKKDKLLLFDALCNYALNDIEPELVGAPSAIFKLLKPQVDANARRYENGKRGGRPKKNQTETKTKPNENQTETKAEPKEQVKVKDKDKVKDKVKEQLQQQEQGQEVPCRGSGLYDDEFNIFKLLGAEGIDQVYDVYPDTGGDLIQEVYEDVKTKRKRVTNPVAYVLGYAKNVGWSDQRGGAS